MIQSLTSSSLAHFLKTDLFEKWKEDRQPVEKKWRKNEDAYNSISNGFWKIEEAEKGRSNTFIPATKNKILVAYSIVIDLLLSNGQIPFTLTLSPWDKIVMEDLPEDQQEKIQDDINDMKELINQQVLDCKGDRELMKCVMSAARSGETYWKSYVHDVQRNGYQQTNIAPAGGQFNPGRDVRFERYENTVTAPAFKYVSCWDMFRDMETDDMQRSRGCCERSHVSAYDLRQLIGKSHYIDENIERAIRDNSQGITPTDTDTEKPGLRDIKNRYNNIMKLEFWCRVPRETLERYEHDLKNKKDVLTVVDPQNDGDEVEIGACMAGEEIIRLVRIKQDTRPHGRVVWEINLDDNHGIGVADNVESMQMVLNGMWRAFEDNKKLSANVIIAIKKALLSDWDGVFIPGEAIEVSEEAKTVAEAISQIIIQDVGESLLSGIGLAERYIDEDSLLPKILQGAVHDKQKADTLGEINILQSNAGKYIGSVTKNFDEGMIEDIVTRFFEYNMNDPDVTKGKGNYIAKSLGFSGFQNKFIRLPKIMQALNLALNAPPVERETKIKPLLEELYKILDLDPQTLFKTREEKEADSQQVQKAQQAQIQQMEMTLLAKFKHEIEKIQATSEGKLAQIEADHRNKMKEIDAESENRIIEKKAVGVVK